MSTINDQEVLTKPYIIWDIEMDSPHPPYLFQTQAPGPAHRGGIQMSGVRMDVSAVGSVLHDTPPATPLSCVPGMGLTDWVYLPGSLG